jgi:cell division septal protein FtsQ
MLKILVKLVVLSAAVALGRFAYERMVALPYFALGKIELKGNLEIGEDSLETMTGLEMGGSIFKQNLEYATLRLSRSPGVIKCTVSRGLTSTISIDIDRAEPVLLIKGAGVYSVSREGIVLPFDDRVPVLPLITGRSFSRARCYDRLEDPDIAHAVELYDGLHAVSEDLSGRLSEINFSSGAIMNLYFSPQGTRVILDKRDFGDAINRLAVLQESGILEGERVFDLRFGQVAVESSSGKEIL